MYIRAYISRTEVWLFLSQSVLKPCSKTSALTEPGRLVPLCIHAGGLFGQVDHEDLCHLWNFHQ